MKTSLTITILVSCLFLTACSSMFGGGHTDEGQIHLSDEDLALQATEYGEGNIPLAKEGGLGRAGGKGALFQDIFFAYDSSAIDSKYQRELQLNAKVLANDPSLRIEVEGHCDNRGTNEYNLALGEERAKAVASRLMSYGASRKQVNIISYGEEIPVDPANNESAYAKNRRVHFALSREN
jgi:peptidoglycan-associated lipoprotein